MFRLSAILLVATLVSAAPASPQAPGTPPAAPTRPVRSTPPTRDPNTPGYVAAKALPDGTNAPANLDGNFIIGPTYNPAPETVPQTGVQQLGVQQGTVYELTMNSTDSKIYPGIAREPGTFGITDPADPGKLIVTTSHPAPYTRHLAVYVPKQYVPGTAVPFIVARPHALYRAG